MSKTKMNDAEVPTKRQKRVQFEEDAKIAVMGDSKMDGVDNSKLPQTEDAIMACVLPPAAGKGFDVLVDEHITEEIERAQQVTGSSPYMASLYEGQKSDIKSFAPKITIKAAEHPADVWWTVTDLRTKLTVVERETMNMSAHMLKLIEMMQTLITKNNLQI